MPDVYTTILSIRQSQSTYESSSLIQNTKHTHSMSVRIPYKMGGACWRAWLCNTHGICKQNKINHSTLEASLSIFFIFTFIFDNSIKMLELLALHRNAQYTEEAVRILQEEWPRNKSERMEKLLKSNDGLRPTCYVLVDTTKNMVIGYVKLTAELPLHRAVFLESLVIDKCHRGKGYGRKIIQLVEQILGPKGFDRINLTTTD